jgi:hypothetical protein
VACISSLPPGLMSVEEILEKVFILCSSFFLTEFSFLSKGLEFFPISNSRNEVALQDISIF